MEFLNKNHLHSDRLADPVMKLIHGARNFKLLEKAIELGLFDELASSQQPVSADRIAKKHGFNLDKLTRFLDALCSIDLIRKSRSPTGKFVYFNDDSTTKYLTRSQKTSLVPIAMMESKMVLPLFDKLPALLEKDASTDIMTKKEGVDMNGLGNKMSTPPTTTPNGGDMSLKALETQMKFLMCMDGIAAPCARSIARAFDLSAFQSAVDLGGGPGTIGIELAKTYPSMDITVLDLPNVVRVAQKLKPNVPDNVHFYQGNFFENPIPTSQLYILSHVIHDWSPEHVDDLLDIVFSSMPPGSSLLVLEKILDESRDSPVLAATYNLAMSFLTKGAERTETEYRTLLEDHGFEQIAVKRISGYNLYDCLLCRKPSC